MKLNQNKCIKALVCALFGMGVTAASAATYFIDYDGGADSNAGTSPTAAFKHCPGDSAAEGNAVTAKFEAGDKIIFKGGVVYRGTVNNVGSGEAGQPIVYDGNTEGKFGTGKAIIDGSELVTGWKPCASQEEAKGNWNWKKIWTAWVPEAVDPLTANCFEGDRMLGLAQEPNLKDVMYFDDLSTFRTIHPGQFTVSTVTDPANLSKLKSEDLKGAYMLIWAEGNGVPHKKITEFNPQEGKVTFEKVSSIYLDRDTHYALLNYLGAMDVPGEYVVSDEKDGKGNRKVYLWPVNGGEPKGVTVSRRPVGFNFGQKSHLTFQGFVVQKQSGSTPAALYNSFSYNSVVNTADLIVRDNLIRYVRCTDRSGAMALCTTDNLLVEGNEVMENPGCRGILLQGCTHSKVRGNKVKRTGGTGICFFTCTDCEMTGNELRDNNGVHANGLTAYAKCKNVLIRNNRVFNSNIALTTQDSSNVTIAYNLLIGPPHTFADWGKSDGLIFLNNTIITTGTRKGGGDYAVHIGIDTKGVVMKNNILSGADAAGKRESQPTLSHNIYTFLAWQQKENSLEEGSKFIRFAFDLFVDPEKENYHLKTGSPAIGAGVDVGLEKDLDGKPLPKGKSPDLGAYQFMP